MRLLALLPLLPLTAANLVSVRPSKPDLRLSQLLNLLECSTGDATVRALCSVVSARLSAALASANIQFTPNSVLFTYDDPTDRSIDTGHSCTVTASITNTHAEAALLSSASLDFSGNPLSVSDPGLFVAELPVSVSARIDAKQKFGQRLLGKCVGLGSDSFKVSGGVSTTAQVAILFSFGPAPPRQDAQGNWVFTIKPITKVAAQLGKTDIDFNISGVSFLSGLVSAILGGTSSAWKAVTHILKGDSLSKVWADVKRSVIDVAVGTVMSIPFDLLDNLVEVLAQHYIDEKQGKLASQASVEFEKRLREMVAKALGLNANGERSFVVKKEVVELVAQFGVGADVFLVDKPAGYCANDKDCVGGTFCNGGLKCVNEQCVAGTRPCVGGERCNEASKFCVPIDDCGRRQGGRITMCP